ncbi:MAG: hypothetical protein PSX81_03090 [bacterium]|nr:hypothetical protein [bacterium]
MTTLKTYISSIDKQLQQQLGILITKYAAYSSKTMYGDIIVPRDHVIDFINGLTIIGIIINSVNWWCNATDDNKTKYSCPHDYGGPMTKFGWFSEMCHDFDEIIEIENELFISLDNDFKLETIKNINEKAINLIKNKRTITYADGTYLTFENNPCLTPGLDLYVPDNWKR